MRKQFSKTLFFEQIFHFHNKNSTTFGFVHPFIQKQCIQTSKQNCWGKSIPTSCPEKYFFFLNLFESFVNLSF